MKKELTIEDLKAMNPGEIFAEGTVENSPDGVFMTNSNIGKELCWVAKRGGYWDWAIYIHWADKGRDFVITNGDKVMTDAFIKRLVPCNDEAFNMYRA